MKTLRNKARQRRAIPKYLDDFNILLNEANFVDEKILKKANNPARQGNTVALTVSINLIMNNFLDFINKGFELNLYSLQELPMVFAYSKYIY